MKKALVLAAILLTVFTLAFDSYTFVNEAIGEPDTLDPHLAYNKASGEDIYQVYENLILYKGSSVSEFEPRIATKFQLLKTDL